MPDETLITQIENLLSEVIRLGGENERTQIVPNLTVQNATPTGLSGFIIVSDDRDGDNILAKKVPGVIYSNNDLVNIMFVKGGEAIAFQQGSGSSNSGIWETVTGTTTDIYYDKGDVGIGKSVAPDASLEILDTTQPQLRLTFQEDTKYADFTVDTNHDLTIDPSSTGQIILASDDITIGEDLIHSGDIDTKITFTDDKISFDAGGLNLLALTETTQDLVEIGDVAGGGDVDINFNNGQMFLQGSNGRLAIGHTSPSNVLDVSTSCRIFDDGNVTFRLSQATTDGVSASYSFRKSRGTHASPTIVANNDLIGQTTWQGYDGASFVSSAVLRVLIDGAPAAGVVPSKIVYQTTDTAGSRADRVVIKGDGKLGINGVGSPSTELDIGAGAMEFDEMTAPGGGAANTARLYAVDNGAGKTQLAVVFNTGAAQILATEP